MCASLMLPVVGFSAETFDKLFPFHVVFGGDGAVAHAGPGLRDLAPSVCPGAPASVLAVAGGAPLTVDALEGAMHESMLLRVSTEGLLLRGEVARLEGGSLVFVGSPWPVDNEELGALPAPCEAYAAHDPTPDLHQLLEMQNFALEEAHALAARLEDQRKQLLAHAKELEDKQRTILRLSAPTIQLWDEVLAVPIVGVLDARRVEALMKAVAAHVTSHASRFVLVDLTGAEALDTSTVRSLGNLASVARMLGARFMLTGLQPEIAQTVVELGLDMTSFESFVTVSDALREVFASTASARSRALSPRERLARARARMRRAPPEDAAD